MKIKGTVYRIISDAPDGRFYVYVGSTTQDIMARLAQHKYRYDRYVEGKLSQDVGSFKIMATGFWEIHPEEEIEFENVRDLLEAERRAYDKYSNDPDYIITNKNVPARTPAEYYDTPVRKASMKRYQKSEKGRAAIRRANKKYYESHKQTKLERMREKYWAQKNAPQNEPQPPNPDGGVENWIFWKYKIT